MLEGHEMFATTVSPICNMVHLILSMFIEVCLQVSREAINPKDVRPASKPTQVSTEDCRLSFMQISSFFNLSRSLYT